MRHRRVTTALLAVLSTGALFAGMTGAASAQPETGPDTAACQNAKDAFKQAQADYQAARKALDDNRNQLRRQIAELKVRLAELPATVPNTDTEDPTDVIPNPKIAELQGKIDGLQSTLDNLADVRDLRDAAKQARDKACTPPATPPATPPVTTSAEFKNCDEVTAAGLATLPRSDDRYRRVLDADRDGIACEDPEGTPPVTTPPVTNTQVVWCVIEPGKCSQVEVDGEGRLVRVIRSVECERPTPPVTGVRRGERVTVVDRTFVPDVYELPGTGSTTTERRYERAPKPPIVDSDLPVTH